jgi:hypothetical protein
MFIKKGLENSIFSLKIFPQIFILKSRIGSCIAPKAGLARHPAKGRYGAESTFRIFDFGIQG